MILNVKSPFAPWCLLAALVAAALAGCGQKGPLYLPAKPAPVPAAQPAPAATGVPAPVPAPASK